MQSVACKTFTIAKVLWVLPVLAAQSCAQLTSPSTMTETLIAGAEYARYLELPSRRIFGAPIDRHEFRRLTADPEVWAVGARRQEESEPGSDNAFEIPSGNRVPQDEWLAAEPAQKLRLRRAGRGIQDPEGGFTFEGHRYPVRGTGSCGLDAMRGDLVVVMCSQGTFLRETTGKTIDFFDGRSGQRLAALDLKYDRPDYTGGMDLNIHLLSSRWTAIALDRDFRKLLLFDFDSAFRSRGRSDTQ